MLTDIITTIKESLPKGFPLEEGAQALTRLTTPPRVIVTGGEETFTPGESVRDTQTGRAVKAHRLRTCTLEHTIWGRNLHETEELLLEYLDVLSNLPLYKLQPLRGVWVNAQETSVQRHGEFYVLHTSAIVPVIKQERWALLEEIAQDCLTCTEGETG